MYLPSALYPFGNNNGHKYVCTLELVSHQHHRQILVDTAHPAAVDLDKLQSRRLEELLKHHPVVTLNRKPAPSSTSSQTSLLVLEVPKN